MPLAQKTGTRDARLDLAYGPPKTLLVGVVHQHQPKHSAPARFDERSDSAVVAQADYIAKGQAVDHERNAGQCVPAVAQVVQPDLLKLTGEAERGEVDVRDVVGVSALDRVRVDDIKRTWLLSRTHAVPVYPRARRGPVNGGPRRLRPTSSFQRLSTAACDPLAAASGYPHGGLPLSTGPDR